MDITNDERIQLKKLMNTSDCEDNTNTIRRLKHSLLIREDIRCIEIIKKVHALTKETDPDQYRDICISKCSFLYKNYTDIFNKLLVDELNLDIMSKLLLVLKMIEDEKVDQHEGSVIVGKLLKELYVDSAMRRGEALDKKYESEKVPPEDGKDISWKKYKLSGVNNNA
jgi:hypothetical protein